MQRSDVKEKAAALGKCNAVKQLVMAIGIAHEPIEFDSIDGKSVTIPILLVSPADQTGPHIQALAQISTLMLFMSCSAAKRAGNR